MNDVNGTLIVSKFRIGRREMLAMQSGMMSFGGLSRIEMTQLLLFRHLN